MQEVVHDDTTVLQSENEIKVNYRNQLKRHNMEDVNNKKYQYQDVFIMDLVGESEKLGDYVLNVVVQAVNRKENITINFYGYQVKKLFPSWEGLFHYPIVP